MQQQYPTYQFSDHDAKSDLARFVRIDNPESYPFDSFHAHAYSEFMVFLKGGGTHNINFEDHTIEDNSIHHIAANDLHWVERSMGSMGFAIVYKDQFLHKLQYVNTDIDFARTFGSSRILNFKVDEFGEFQLIIKELLANSTPSGYLLQLIGLFLAKIAYTLKEEAGIAAPLRPDPLVTKAIALIEKHYKQRYTISQYATMLHTTDRTLQNRVKKASGSSINDLQQQRLLKEAKRMLCISGKNISEISFDLGFKDVAYFSNWFRKMADCQPSEYKYGL